MLPGFITGGLGPCCIAFAPVTCGYPPYIPVGDTIALDAIICCGGGGGAPDLIPIIGGIGVGRTSANNLFGRV